MFDDTLNVMIKLLQLKFTRLHSRTMSVFGIAVVVVVVV